MDLTYCLRHAVGYFDSVKVNAGRMQQGRFVFR